ncbi:C40 family peptidase [Nesterenkonia populi]
MTENTEFASRRDRRRARGLAGAVSAHAGAAGRTAAASLAASGLVIGSGVAANASETSADEGREATTVEVTTGDLSVERASSAAPVSVTASRDAELAFERPAVTSESAAPAEEEAEPAPAQTESAPASQEQAQSQPAQTQQEPAQESSGQSSAAGGQAEQSQSDDSQSGPQAASGGDSSSSESSDSGAGSGSIVSAAHAALGTPYSWGGTTTGGMDCSGFINWAYARAGGPSVPRTTHGMMASLPRVSSPQPGDIVIANGQSHGGIYIGNGQVISATVSNGVSIHSLHAGWHNPTAYLRPGG